MGFISLTLAGGTESPENLLAVHEPEPPQSPRHFRRGARASPRRRAVGQSN